MQFFVVSLAAVAATGCCLLLLRASNRGIVAQIESAEKLAEAAKMLALAAKALADLAVKKANSAENWVISWGNVDESSHRFRPLTEKEYEALYRD